MLDWFRNPPARTPPMATTPPVRALAPSLKLTQPGLWLGLLGISLLGLHLLMLSHADQPEQFNTSVLLWAAVIYLLWEKRQSLYLRSDLFATSLGSVLLSFVLWRTYSPAGYHLSLSPLLSGVGLGLLASGRKRLLSYAKELAILTLPIVALVVQFLLELFELPVLTAKFANYLLWSLGFEVQRQGVFILLPTGRVEVYSACSGVSSILQMLTLTVLFLLLFQTTWLQKGLSLVVAVLIGFISNGMRVAIMAWLVAFSNQQAFEYWHGGQGSMVFSVISTLLLIGFFWLAFLRQPPAPLQQESDLEPSHFPSHFSAFTPIDPVHDASSNSSSHSSSDAHV
jgi:cyanoexosortase A